MLWNQLGMWRHLFFFFPTVNVRKYKCRLNISDENLTSVSRWNMKNIRLARQYQNEGKIISPIKKKYILLICWNDTGGQDNKDRWYANGWCVPETGRNPLWFADSLPNPRMDNSRFLSLVLGKCHFFLSQHLPVRCQRLREPPHREKCSNQRNRGNLTISDARNFMAL